MVIKVLGAIVGLLIVIAGGMLFLQDGAKQIGLVSLMLLIGSLFIGNLFWKPTPKENNITSSISNRLSAELIWIISGIGLFILLMGGINKYVSSDAEKQYEIAKSNGSTADTCVHASITAASYLQAHDEDNYRKWKSIEARECGDPIAR